jgi:NADPH-dependent 2,4-dienoyl-CoA reductase/sulfur reductase-like enzyme
VEIRSGTRPARFEGDVSVKRAVLEDGSVRQVSLVVLGVGIRLDAALARNAGLAMGERGEVIVDEYLRTSNSDIFAAGDIAAWPDPTFGTRLRVEHWDVARRQGLRAGRAMGGDLKPYVSLPYFFSDLFELSFEVWGNLDRWDETVLRGALESGSFALYYFDQGRLTGVLAVGRPDAERKPMQALVKKRAEYALVADALRDDGTDLSML